MVSSAYETAVFRVGNPPNSIVERSKRGCFNCRKRKKKCDEIKPECRACSSRCIPCVWPTDYMRSLPKHYEIPKPDVVLKKLKKLNKFIKYDHSQPEAADNEFQDTDIGGNNVGSIDVDRNILSTSNLSSALMPVDSDISNIENNIFNHHTLQDLDFHLQSEESSCNFESLDDEYNHIFNPRSSLKIIWDDDYYMIVSSSVFITTSGPQLTHPLLSTTANFTPFTNNNDIMRNVMAACGCIFMMDTTPNLRQLGDEKFTEAMSCLNKYVERNGTSALDENWVATGYQLLYIISKLLKTNVDGMIANMSQTYEIIKKRFYSKNSLICGNSSIEKQNSMVKKTPSTRFCEESTVAPTTFSSKSFNKLFIESFIYHYSVIILTLKDHSKLPGTPDFIFNMLNSFLKTPMFECDVSWMNNPVLGASLDCYEYVAKASYLCRIMTDIKCNDGSYREYEVVRSKAKHLLQSLDGISFREDEIPSDLQAVDPLKYAYLKDSVSVAKIVKSGCHVLLRKIITMDLSETDDLLQIEVQKTIDWILTLNQATKVKCVSIWAILVTGSCAIDSYQRKIFIDFCDDIAKLNHGSNYINTVKSALYIAWGKGQSLLSKGLNSGIINTSGIDILFDRDVLDHVVM